MSNTNGIATGHLDEYAGRRGTTYYAKVRPPKGNQRKIRLGKKWDQRGRPPEGYLTEKMAEARVREIVADAGRGLLATATPSLGVTLRQAADEYMYYIEFDRKRRYSTVRGYRSIVDGGLVAVLGANTLIEEISVEDVDDMRLRLIKEGKSASTINQRLILLAGLLRRAQKNHGLKTNVALEVERQPIKSSGHIAVFEPTEVFSVAKAAVSSGLMYATMIVFAAFTGLRMGELRELRWDDIDFTRSFINVRGSYVRGKAGLPKSGKVRAVPLVEQARDALVLLRESSDFTDGQDFVFAAETGERVDDDKTRKRFRKACREAGLRVLRFHDLRHTFGTLAVNVWDLAKVQTYMGHAHIQTTMIYVHAKAKEDDAAALSAYIAQQSRAPQLIAPAASIETATDETDDKGLVAA